MTNLPGLEPRETWATHRDAGLKACSTSSPFSTAERRPFRTAMEISAADFTTINTRPAQLRVILSEKSSAEVWCRERSQP